MYVPFPRIGRCVAKWCVAVSVCVATALCFALAGVAYAEQETGSITLKLGGETKEQAALVGGKIALYCVATVDRSGGARFDVSKGQFANAEVVANIPNMSTAQLDEQNASISAELEKQAKSSGLAPLMSASINQGSVTFSPVSEGLYLLVQTELSQGNRKMNTFLLSVPDKNGQLNIVAQPKSGIYTPDQDKPSDQDKDDSGNTDSKTTDNTPTSNVNTSTTTSNTTTPSISYRVPTMADPLSTSSLALLVTIGTVFVVIGTLGHLHTRNSE